MFQKCASFFDGLALKLTHISFISPFILRLYLSPIFWMAGTQKLSHMESTIHWFGNAEWGLGLPFPTFLAYLAAYTEIIGAVCLLLGMATRLICVPLIITMLVAILSVHIDNGWLAISASSSEASIRLTGFLNWLQTHYPARHEYITELAQPVMLNNGVEFAVTYLIMLISLLFSGSGRFLSVDYWALKLSKPD